MGLKVPIHNFNSHDEPPPQLAAMTESLKNFIKPWLQKKSFRMQPQAVQLAPHLTTSSEDHGKAEGEPF